MDVQQILKEIRKSGINISLEGANLKISSNAEMPQALLAKVKEHKEAIIQYLSKNGSHTSDHASIPLLPVQDCYPLSSAQQRLWILSQFEEANVAYNMPAVYVFKGVFNRPAFENVFKELLSRHEILRTVFREDEEGEVKQFIKSDIALTITYEDLRAAENKERLTDAAVRIASQKPFDLQNGPMLRAGLLQLEDDKYVFIYVMHHIITDGWSMQLLFNELLRLYTASTKNKINPLLPLRIQYKEYAAWQQDQLKHENAAGHKRYWLEQFSSDLPIFELGQGNSRPVIKSYNGGIVNGKVDKTIAAPLKVLCHQSGGTLFMGLLTAVNALLYRYSGQSDIIIGTSVAGREHTELEDQVGFYINTLALRSKFSGENSCRTLLEIVKSVTLNAYEHQSYPFDTLVNELKLQRNPGRHPLFDIGIVLQNINIGGEPADTKELPEFTVNSYGNADHVISKFDLTFTFMEAGEEIIASVEYNSDIYSKNTIERLFAHLERIMRAMTAHPDQPINELDYLHQDEKEWLTNGVNATDASIPKNKTLTELFEQQVKHTPGHTALSFEKRELTYSELNEQANQFASYLLNHYTLKADDIVAVKLDRSDRAIIAILGVMKSGAAYVPVDSEYPEERINYMLKDSGSKVLVDEKEFNAFISEQATFGTENHVAGRAENLAYMIYTSGSTGFPKGVMIEHHSIVNTILSMQQIFDMKAGERHLQFASLSFDASVCEMFMALLSGGGLYIIPEKVKKDISQAEDYVQENKIEIAILPPAYLQLLNIEKVQSIKKMITAGDAPLLENVKAYSAHGIYYNAYGPTESSICASVFKIDSHTKLTTGQIPVGRPIANTRLYILDDRMQLMPVGLVGEICIGGAGLARGYLNQPQLTAEKFVENPFRKGERMYKTGDLGRWLENGMMEFISRKDEQVKVRGYRIEPGEVKNALQKLPGVKNAAVVVLDKHAREKELAAYVVGSNTLNMADLRSLLAKQLPAYMLPSYFIRIDELPLNSSGKLDKKQLPVPAESLQETGQEYIAPRNDIEVMLVEIWKEVLDRNIIGIKDNFFDIGGNSIRIIKLSKLVTKALGREINVAMLFQYSNIESLVDYLNSGQGHAAEEFNEEELINDLNKFDID